MHHRDTEFFLPSPDHTSIRWQHAPVARGTPWTRISVALDGAPHVSRSRALDPAAEVHRTWSSAVELPEGEVREDLPPEVLNRTWAPHAGVEGEANPHEDTRGVEEVTIHATAFRNTGVAVARSREGILLSAPLPEGAAVYGLGEKTASLDRRGRSWLMWNSDEPTHSPDRDALYQSHPVCYLFTPEETITWFADSLATVWVDAGETCPDRLMFEVYDDRCQFYVRRDPTLPAAVGHYSDLTGHMPLPPEWALGFQQCRYSYFPADRVLEVARQFRQEQIPCDVLYLDIHYMDGYRVFTWDPARFPAPGALVAALRDEGFRVVTIVDPGVKADPDYSVFYSGNREGYFLQRPDGTTYLGTVWPGAAGFPDFSREAVRTWWGRQHDVLLDEGVAGIWNDMNEPADFSGDPVDRRNFTVPDDLVAQTDDGEQCAFHRVHNGYANGMNEGCRGGLNHYRKDERGFVLTRAGSPGVQRSAAVWTGDNHSWWEHLAMMVPMFTSVGLSGIPFVGGDAGGFQQNASPELYQRWIAAAAFTPFFRAHSALDTSDHEPWSFGPAALETARRYITLRYQLLPYLYTLFEEASRTGAPVMRPLVWEFPRDPRVHNRADSFLLGPALLVAPVREPGVQERSVYLPAGVWYDFYTGERYGTASRQPSSARQATPDPRTADNGTAITAAAPPDHLPLYVRGGTIIPWEAPRQHTGAPGDGVLRLLAAPGVDGTAAGEVYGDAGEGWGCRDGERWRAPFVWNGTVLEGRSEGSPAVTRWHSYAVYTPGDQETPVARGSLEEFLA